MMMGDSVPKGVNKNRMLSRMEATLYTDTIRLVRKKRDEWLNAQAEIFHLVLQHSPPELRELYRTMSAQQSIRNKANRTKLLCMVQ